MDENSERLTVSNWMGGMSAAEGARPRRADDDAMGMGVGMDVLRLVGGVLMIGDVATLAIGRGLFVDVGDGVGRGRI